MSTKKENIKVTDRESFKKKWASAVVDKRASMTSGFTTSGSVKIDKALSGGFPKGKMVELYGPPRSGKTSIALATAAAALKRKERIAFVDLERALDLIEGEEQKKREKGEEPQLDRISWLRRNGINPMDENFDILDPDSGEEMFEILEDIIAHDLYDLVIVDSVAAIVTEAELESDIRTSHYGAVARLLSVGLKRLQRRYKRPKGQPSADTIIVWINQVRDIIGGMVAGKKSTGGNALEHYVSTRLMIQRIGEKKEGEDMITRSRVRVMKSRFSPPGSFEIEFSSERGLDVLGELLDFGLDSGYVHQSGSWFTLFDTPLTKDDLKGVKEVTEHPNFVERRQGRGAFKDFLADSPWRDKLFRLATS